MVLTPPRIGKPLSWALAACVVIGFPVTSWVYWPAVLEAGVLPPEADTIMIPMASSVMVAVLLTPIVGCITWLCLRGANGASSLLAWDRGRPARSTLVTLCFAIPFGFGLSEVAEELTALPGWYGMWWLPYTLITLLWLAVMRGAALSSRRDA